MRRGQAHRSARLAALACFGGLTAAWMAFPPAAIGELHAAAGPHVVFRISAPRITESSSLVQSTVHPPLLYTANDSGDGPYVYVLSPTGRLVGTTTLLGVDPVDVEAMATGADGSLIFGDVGDNDSNRPNVAVYRIAQPGPGPSQVEAQKVTLTYQGGPRNAESMLYDSSTGRVYIMSKLPFGGVYESPPEVFSLRSATMRPIATAPSFATDATFLAGHHAVVVRTYRSAYVYRFPSWHLLTSFTLPAQRQGESVTTDGSRALLVGSEGTDSPVWSVPLPASVLSFLERSTTKVQATTPPPGKPAHGPGPPPEPVPVVANGDSTAKTVVTVSSSAVVLVVVAGAVVFIRRRPKPPAVR
jgi:hypothetical protein